MQAEILDGRLLGRKIRDALRTEVEGLYTLDAPPNLVSLQVGECEPSRAYIQHQKRACEEHRILYSHVALDAHCTERQLAAHVRGVCGNPEVTGLIIQLPVPERLDVRKAYHAMDPRKDVEGMHPSNLGAVLLGETGMQPCTALAVLSLLDEAGILVRGAEACVVGHSHIVGKPIGMLLLNRDATVTTCHAHTANLAEKTRRADILVSAAGSPGLITADHVKPGAIVVDVGMSYPQGSGRPVGDVRFEEVREIASFVTPVPGGVGPVTIAMLLRNTVLAAKAQCESRVGGPKGEGHGAPQEVRP